MSVNRRVREDLFLEDEDARIMSSEKQGRGVGGNRLRRCQVDVLAVRMMSAERHHGKKGVFKRREARSRLRKGQKAWQGTSFSQSAHRVLEWPVSRCAPVHPKLGVCTVN
jgi:hypothetical protein